MCGIVGIWNYISEQKVDTKHVKDMCQAIRHRGPDGEGVEILGNLGLGHRRLSIIDLATGKQPMADSEKRVWVTFNGEIYNYRELRHEFEVDGVKFKTESDTEVIPYCYLKYGKDFPAKLEGMFAIALWDRREEQLLLIRDRMGKKPLLYFNSPNGLVFASEIQALAKHPDFKNEISAEGLDAFLTLGYVPHTHSIFQGVKKIAPAHTVMVNTKGDYSVKCYWSVDLQNKISTSQHEAKQQLHALLKDSIEKRLISDVPLGAFLSGGTDSSLIAAIASESNNSKLKTFCIGFDENTFDERRDARAVADILGTDHYEERVTFDGMSILPKLQKHFGEPFADASAIPTYFLCQHLRKDVTVALSGDGGDELFLGYNRYQRLAKRHAVHELVNRLPIAGLLADSSRRRSMRRQGILGRIINMLEDSGLPVHEQFTASSAVFSRSARSELYNDNYRQRFLTNTVLDRVEDLFEQFSIKTFQEQVGHVDQNLYMVDDILSKVDIASMAASLEVRAPLLDYKVVEFAAALPLSYKQHRMQGKVILKSLLADYIPRELVDKPKQGFAVPVADWIRTNMREMTNELLLSPTGFIAKHFDQKKIEGLLSSHMSGRQCFKDQLFPLLCLGLWAEEYGLSGG